MFINLNKVNLTNKKEPQLNLNEYRKIRFVKCSKIFFINTISTKTNMTNIFQLKAPNLNKIIILTLEIAIK
jgi:hypothetical protein